MHKVYYTQLEAAFGAVKSNRLKGIKQYKIEITAIKLGTFFLLETVPAPFP